MKRIAFALSLVAATAMAAAPLAAQTRSNGPWWDPGRTQTQTQPRNGGSVYGNNGHVYGQQNEHADGVWRAYSHDRNGNTVYMRTRYDSNGNLVREYATRNIIGRYSVIDRQVLGNNSNNNRGTYGRRGTYGNNQGTYGNRRRDNEGDDDNNGGYSGRGNQDSNDRWDQNNGHDNGKHNGQYKNKNKNKNKNRDDRDDN